MTRSILVILGSVTLAVVAQVVLKMGMTDVGRIGATEVSRLGPTFFKVFTTPRVLLGLFLYFLSALLWMVVLSRVDLSLAYPFVGLSYLAVALVGRFILQEPVPTARWIGVAVISAGVFIVSRTA